MGARRLHGTDNHCFWSPDFGFASGVHRRWQDSNWTSDFHRNILDHTRIGRRALLLPSRLATGSPIRCRPFLVNVALLLSGVDLHRVSRVAPVTAMVRPFTLAVR